MEWKKTGVLYVKYDKILIDAGFELKYAKEGDVGLDLPVVINDKLKVEPYRDYYINKEEGWFDIPPRGIAEIPCGMAIKVPEDAWANIKPRSSTAWKRHLTVSEAIIDCGYIGPLFILTINPNNEPVRIHDGDKLAQMIIIPKYKTKIELTNQLPETERGATGFGSSGGLKESTRPSPLE